jgi:two-component system, OmpR family, sensor histidine kinase KdpD
MTWPWRRALPYLAGMAGAAGVTAVIWAVRPLLDIPNLAVAYLLVVLWLGARWGWPPAVFAAVLAFLAYDWFLVPPYGTLYISAPRELLNLVVLLVAAVVGGRLAASLAAGRAGAEASARESGVLNEVAIAALRDPEAAAALRLLCERAVAGGGLAAISLVAFDDGRPEVVAGSELPAEDLERARWAFENGTNVGAYLNKGRLKVTRTFPAGPPVAHVVVAGGVAVLRFRETALGLEVQRLLAALLGLAGLLLDRRRAALGAERMRSLEASDRLKAAILSSISHELKSPLTSLRAGLTTLLMPEAHLDPEQRELASGMDRQAARLDRLVGDLLTMSKLEAGLPIDRSPQDFAEMTGAVLSSLGPRLAGFELRVELPPDLPPVLADELQVERLLANLLENASEWTPAGGRITLGAAVVAEAGGDPGAETAGDRLSAWVENQGPDILPADLTEVFDKFWTRREGGSGLGLAISRRIVEAHGGEIRAENTRQGPRFTFTLPLVPQLAAAP